MVALRNYPHILFSEVFLYKQWLHDEFLSKMACVQVKKIHFNFEMNMSDMTLVETIRIDKH